MAEPNYKQILINLCAGAHLADHMGDMASDIYEALEQAKIITKEESREFSDLSELSGFLVLEHQAKTVWGTELGEEND